MVEANIKTQKRGITGYGWAILGNGIVLCKLRRMCRAGGGCLMTMSTPLFWLHAGASRRIPWVLG